jgi:hypothetical protein
MRSGEGRAKPQPARSQEDTREWTVNKRITGVNAGEASGDTVTAWQTRPAGLLGDGDDGDTDQYEEIEMEQTTHRCTAASIGATFNKRPQDAP